MARVIKGKGAKTASRQEMGSETFRVDRSRVIEKEVFLAEKEAKRIREEGVLQRKDRLGKGKKIASQKMEEAMATAAGFAFAELAKEALNIFHDRAQNYKNVESDVKELSLEIAHRVLSTKLTLSDASIEKIVGDQVSILRASRHLILQVPNGRIEFLKKENFAVMKQIEDEPDVDFEEVLDVNEGFLRVVTSMGSALCDEAAAIETLKEGFQY